MWVMKCRVVTLYRQVHLLLETMILLGALHDVAAAEEDLELAKAIYNL